MLAERANDATVATSERLSPLRVLRNRFDLLLVLALLLPEPAWAKSDPTNDPTRERQVYQVMLERYASKSRICVVQKPDDFPRYSPRRGPLHQFVDWTYFDVDEPAKPDVAHDFFTLEDTQRAPVVGHYISPDLLSANMKLTDADKFCTWPRLTLSAPAFVGQTAFIDLTYDCTLCGLGATYALRFRGGRWAVVAEWTHWVS